MAVDIGPRIGLTGEKDFKDAIKNVNQQIKTLNSEMKLLTTTFGENEDSQAALAGKTDVLTRKIDAQKQKVALLADAYLNSAKRTGDTSTETLRFEQQLNDAKRVLRQMQDDLTDTQKDMLGLGDAASETGDNLDGLKGKFGAALGVGAAVVGVKELTEGLIGLEEGSREYRRIMGTLEVSSQRMGYSAEQTAETYDRFYQVLGDSQAAATATANLQAVGLTQEKTTQLVDSAIGAWAKYGDSIPIESLSEAINETIQAGQVTGTFADVLNWAGMSEDEFNTKLANANSTAERAQLVLDTLATQGLPDAAEQWRNLNGDIVAANDAQNNMEQALGRLGETLAPAATALLNFGADVIDWLTDKVTYLWDVLSKPPEIDPDLMAETNAFINGSHAMGLNRVPFDGYIAELHQGEMILPAAQAESLRALMTASPSAPETDFSGIAAGMVNGITTAMSSMGGNYRIEIPIYFDTREVSRAIVPNLRAEMKANPEVTDD